MPTFEKLAKEEIHEILKKKQYGNGVSKRELILANYVKQLEHLNIGEGLAIKLEPSDNRQTIKNRLMRAAKRLGFEIAFIRSRNVIRLYRTK